MPDIEDAYRALDLDESAGLKDVVEAREDLLALWNPHRLSSTPRLRSKAPAKIREIQAAYETLMQHLGEPGNKGSSGQSMLDGSASLYNEVFSKSSKSPVPLWLIVILAVVVIVAALYLLPTGSRPSAIDPQPVVDSPTAPSAETGMPATANEPEAPPATQASTEVPPAAASTGQPSPTPRTNTASTAAPSRQGPKPLLKRREIGTTQTDEQTESDRQADEAQRAAQLAKAERAYQKLVAESGAARRLAQGELLDLRVAERQVVQQTDSEVWIDLVAVRSGGQPVHYIWAVPLADAKPRPLSEAARELEGGKTPVGSKN